MSSKTPRQSSRTFPIWLLIANFTNIYCVSILVGQISMDIILQSSDTVARVLKEPCGCTKVVAFFRQVNIHTLYSCRPLHSQAQCHNLTSALQLIYRNDQILMTQG